MLASLFLSALVIFCTQALQAVTGFGSSVLAMPFVTALLGMREGIMIITITAWFSVLYIAISKWKEINLKQFGIISGFMLLGLPLGMFLFRTVNTGLLKKVLALFIIIVSGWQLFRYIAFKKRNITPPRGIKVLPYYLILIAGGIIHGMFSSGGPLVVLYASRALPDKGQFRATLSLMWAFLNTVLIIVYFAEGSMTREIAGNTGVLLPFVVVGIIAGEKVHHKLDERLFSIVVFGLLLVTGLFMLLL